VSDIEQAYLKGLVDYETALIQQYQQLEQMAAAEAQGSALLEQELAIREAAIAQEAYLQGLMAYEESLIRQTMQQSMTQAIAGGPSRADLEKEEVYQIGVLYMEAKQLVSEIEARAQEWSQEMREAHEKGKADAAAALGMTTKSSGSGSTTTTKK
jgi:hypothetical protein